MFDLATTERTPLRSAIDAHYREPEPSAVARLAANAAASPEFLGQVATRARTLIEAVRTKRVRAGGVDALMREFSLSSEEGVALMCLAEALLRIPDMATRDALIRDKIGGQDWDAHLGRSPSLFVNAAAWGLLITGRLVATHSSAGLSAAAARIVAKGGEPLIRKGVDLAMRMLGRQFVTGETIGEAIDQGAPHRARGYRYSYDMLGEAAITAADAKRYLDAYENAIEAIGRHVTAEVPRGTDRVRVGAGISIKLSALHPRYCRSQRERVMQELLPRLAHLARLARSYQIGLNIDAEESERLDLSLDLFEALARDGELAGWDGLGFVVQAYSKRAPFVLDFLVELARSTGRRFMIRLVKGAYWDSEIKRAQVEGQDDYPVFTRKMHTDVSYLACARQLLAAVPLVYPQFATHNAYTLAWVREEARRVGVPASAFEFQCLHGMGETLYDQVIGTPEDPELACRIYAPVGSHETLLAYLVRRLLENGANSSFVNRIVDASVPIEALIEDPIERAQSQGFEPHPAIPAPRSVYPHGRRAARGFDSAHESELVAFARALAPYAEHRFELTARACTHGPERRVTNPARRAEEVGRVRDADDAAVRTAWDGAVAAASSWRDLPAADRAALLERCADALEAHRVELIALAMREAGKTLQNAVGEVREAVDFCRYYAAQVRLAPDVPPRGGAPLVAISPWNFPLAIFSGQIMAALAAGRAVLAKPAEQTPLIAVRAVELFHAAGIPQDVLWCLPGDGRIGAALVQTPGIGGVLFTGSTEVARSIAATLSEAPGHPVLVAETGGENALVVDSSALAEQVVLDVVQSAFDSAGQRCSALRILCLQEDIAESTLSMLKGAMAELTVGDPTRYSTDIGPVIDDEARTRLLAHINRMREAGHSITSLPLPAACAEGTFVAPTLIELSGYSDLPGEVFGPILHVVRFRFGEMGALMNAINAGGYGLTLGVHSRIDEHIALVVEQGRAGNIYVNRNLIGAVVGVQPFGGEGLSGTGPKAGGPLALARFGGPLGFEIRQTQGTLPERTDSFVSALLGGGAPELAQLARTVAAEAKDVTLAQRRCLLGGPTGERNLLWFVPRRHVACVAGSARELVAQAALVHAAGGTPHGDAHLLPPGLSDLVLPLAARAQFDAVLIAPGVAAADSWRRRACTEGPLIPVLEFPGVSVEAVLPWLFHERCASTNTAAAGGNASLMTLAD